MHHLRFRQIHLDFHTSPAIEGIGAAWDKAEWQESLKQGHVDSVTCFSKCHHGWSYHPTAVGRAHPHLSLDLLKAQYEACKEIDVNVPIYISAGVDNVMSAEHPEWRQIGCDGRFIGWASAIIQPGFHMMCFNSPYLDYLCEQIREVVRLYPEADGIFLDIINQQPCCCPACLKVMEENGLDAEQEEDRLACARLGLERYYRETTAATRCDRADYPVFHNSGNIPRGKRDILKWFSHLELESLPTGGWGYDHFPVSAKYCLGLDHDFMGMTGKFHTTWGEFGGYKHPNALRYECAAMLAYGAKCSVGDQLHPNGKIDESTYKLIGAAYAEVEAKEAWCDRVQSVADIGLLSSSSINPGKQRDSDADDGAARILLEGHFLFDVLDREMDFTPYKMLILPDDISIDADLKRQLDDYLAQGGKLFLTGESGIDADGDFLFDLGATAGDRSAFRPDYVRPVPDLRASWIDSPMVMYLQSRRLTITDGESLGQVHDPYFNRKWNHFCSHQHTPYRPEASGYACGVQKGNLLYLAHPVFTIYKGLGAVAYREYVQKAIARLLGTDATVAVNLPSTGRVTLMKQPEENRYVLHLLYANTINRGGPMELSGGTTTAKTKSVEVIEDLVPLHNVEVSLTLPDAPKAVALAPQGTALAHTCEGATVSFALPELCCHQMVVFEV